MRIGSPPAAILRFAAWPDRHPGITFLLLILLATVSTILAAQLPAARYAAAASAALQVRAELPGIDALTVQTEVTQPLERVLRELPFSASMESRTREGQAEWVMRFATDAERDRAFAAARVQVAQAVARLPATISAPTVEQREMLMPVVIYAVTAEELSANVIQWVERVLALPLREVSSVAAVAMEGIPQPEILIQPDARRVAAFGLTFDDLILALQRQDQAPSRKRARRMIMPGNVEAIAARAVRLPNGEPIALAEVATVSAAQTQAGEQPRYRGAPALRLAVYPRSAGDVARVSERAAAHLAWLRANGLIPSDVVVNVAHDESRAAKQWLKDSARRAALFVGIALAVVAIVYGFRRGGLLACAYGVWLPVSAVSLWMFGFTLSTATVGAWMLACVPFTAMVAGRRFGGFAVFAVGAAAVVGLLGQWMGERAQFSSAFALMSLVGVLVAWLMTPWMRGGKPRKPPLAAVLPRKWRGHSEALAVGVTAMAVLLAAFLHMNALVGQSDRSRGGEITLRIGGSDMHKLIAIGDELSRSLAKLIGANNVSFSAAIVESWRLQLDRARAGELEIGLAEIGRALAIARGGLVVGEIVHGETLYRLRLQLPAGAAGEQFARLVLRGEQKNQPVVYLRDVGLALREMQPRELRRANGMPVVDISARWNSKETRRAIEQFCADTKLPDGYQRECVEHPLRGTVDSR